MPAVLYARHLDAGPRPLRSIRELLIPSVKNYRFAENGSQLVLTNFFAKLLQLFDCYESVVPDDLDVFVFDAIKPSGDGYLQEAKKNAGLLPALYTV